MQKKTGDLFLRETQELSRLVKRIREVKKDLRKNEEKLRNIVEHSNEMFYLHDTDHNFIYVSPQSVDFFGYTPDEMKIKWTELITNIPQNKTGYDLTEKAINTGVKQKPYILETKRKDGGLILIEIDESPIKDENGDVIAIAGAARDVTERVRMESDLRQACKMESIGTLAGGIAHDFNNLLMGIQGRLSLMMMDMDESDPYAAHLNEIEEHVNSAGDLTKQLLAFARKGKYEVKPVNLNDLIRQTSKMFGRTKKDVKINLKLQQNLKAVEVDRGQLEQVFLNLFINAWQAMPSGGEINIDSDNIVLNEDSIDSFSVTPGDYIKVSVSDTGIGMDEKTKEKIFDPFFTTKEVGRGTGLGLASAYGIIKNHNGVINVTSKKGEGTTFNIFLPASHKKILKSCEIPPKLLQGNETVLLVDDEEMIINIGKALLERLGYEVITAENGANAIEIYKSETHNIDIIILDMIMPVMGGVETYNHLKELNPDIKVLFSSGYNIDEGTSELLYLENNGFIQKPYKFENLSIKLRAILDSNKC